MLESSRRTRPAGRALLALAGLLATLETAGATAVQAQLWQTAPDAPFAFTRFDGEYSVGTGLVYFLGGRLAAGTTDGTIWSFNPATGLYANTGVAMPVPISNYEIARLVDGSGDEVLVVFGGRTGAGTVTTTVQGYYPVSNTTVTFASDPYPVATSPGGVAVVANKAYVFGGFDATAMIASTNIFDILAAAGARWTAGPALGLARSYIATAVVDGFVYALGGASWDGAALHAVAIAERLDTASPVAWDDAGVADLPPVGPGPDFGCDEVKAFGFGAASPFTLAGKIVVAGCGQWPNEIAQSMIYDVALNSWDTSFPVFNLTRRNHAGALVPTGPGSGGNPGMWIWGGRQLSDATVLATPEFFDLQTFLIFDDSFESGDACDWSAAVGGGCP